jgi:hypothetical protein
MEDASLETPTDESRSVRVDDANISRFISMFLRWRLRSMMVLVLFIGLGIFICQLRQRSIYYHSQVSHYATWCTVIQKTIDIVESQIKSDRMVLRSQKRIEDELPGVGVRQNPDLQAALAQHELAARKFTDLSSICN